MHAAQAVVRRKSAKDRRRLLRMAYRRILRDLTRWRLPGSDEQRIRGLLKQVTRTPAGDDVLPAALCTKLSSTYHMLCPSGRLGFISILAQYGVRGEHVQSEAHLPHSCLW